MATAETSGNILDPLNDTFTIILTGRHFIVGMPVNTPFQPTYAQVILPFAWVRNAVNQDSFREYAANDMGIHQRKKSLVAPHDIFDSIDSIVDF